VAGRPPGSSVRITSSGLTSSRASTDGSIADRSAMRSRNRRIVSVKVQRLGISEQSGIDEIQLDRLAKASG